MNQQPQPQFVTRAGEKLSAGLAQFEVDVTGLMCADFGCNIGGFTDCLLQHGAAKVYAIDTGYGELAWKLRQDERVIVMERTNALHLEHQPPQPIDLITIDLGWTRQQHAIPAALRWLHHAGKIISLIKPHYEATKEEKSAFMQAGNLTDAASEKIMERVIKELPTLGVTVEATIASPLRGGKSSRKNAGSGNLEYIALLSPQSNS